nr:TetR family transcriptional regulator [Gordonia araii]
MIGESAIRLISRDGVRALTHRAVDREAGLPEGSTSYHARTRGALLEIIVGRLAEKATADAQAAAESLNEMFAGGGALSIGELARAIGELVGSLAERRDDMRARYALILELDDVPELRGRLTTRSEVHAINRDIAALSLARSGLPNSSEQIEELLSLTDSLVFARTILGDGVSPESVLAAYLHGVAGRRRA